MMRLPLPEVEEVSHPGLEKDVVVDSLREAALHGVCFVEVELTRPMVAIPKSNLNSKETATVPAMTSNAFTAVRQGISRGIAQRNRRVTEQRNLPRSG